MHKKLAFDANVLARAGIHFCNEAGDPRQVQFLDPSYSYDIQIAADAQPGLITTSNSGIPGYLSTFVDPNVIEVALAPMRAAQILGEVQKGDWLTTSAVFPVVESTGQVASYGDHNNTGSSDANMNFPARQPYHYQVITQWGQKELAQAGLAKVDWASQKSAASVKVLNKFQNASYFNGVAGLQNYGLLNDPNLSAALTPTAAWSGTTPDNIYKDIVRLYAKLQLQLNGLIDMTSPMKLVLSTTNSSNLNGTNTYNVNVYDQIKKNFPNMMVVFAPEYTTTGGELVQLIATDVDGKDVGKCAYTEKLRVHATVVEMSAFKQKKSQGTYGAVIKFPAAIAQMLG